MIDEKSVCKGYKKNVQVYVGGKVRDAWGCGVNVSAGIMDRETVQYNITDLELLKSAMIEVTSCHLQICVSNQCN